MHKSVGVNFTLPCVAWPVIIRSILFRSLADRMSQMSLISVRTSSARMISSDALELITGNAFNKFHNLIKAKEHTLQLFDCDPV